MNLQIRHPRVRALARHVADRDGISLTDAVLKALEAEAARPVVRETVKESAERIHKQLFQGRTSGRTMTKEEIDDMWGHPPDDD
jgi:antitoxin VapB